MPTGPDPDNMRLRTALRDLVALSTFPAAWVGREPSAIAAGLADLLVGSLYLDFAFVRLCDPKGGGTVEVTRGDAWRSFPEWLQDHLTVIGHASLREVIPDVDVGGHAEPCRGIVIPIGVDSEGGLVAAASGRTGFPDEIDRLLLSVAANQAATACESARLLHERRRAEEALQDSRNELEKKVAERTAELRRTTADLREREARIRRLVDANIIGIIFWNLEGQILEANDAFLRMVGYDREDLLAGRIHWTDLTPLEWRDRTTQTIEELKRTGATQPFEKQYVRRDGSRVPVLVGRASFEEGGGEGVAFVLDLTERKRIEEELRQREKELREIVETIPAMIVTIVPDGRDAFIGKRFAEYSGLSVEDARGSGWKVTVHPDDLDLYLRKWRLSLMSGDPVEFETRVRRADGEYRWFLARAVALRDEAGNILNWYEVLTDIEDRKRAEAALRESEEQWKAVFENNPVMYFMVDATGIILSVNPFGAEQLGYVVDELIGHHVETVFHEGDREAVRRNAAICFEQIGQALSWELRKVRKDGDVIWVREMARATVINNRPVLLVVCEDITEGKRTTEALREAQAELAHANRVATMGQLTASIAHEVSQPVATARNNASAALHFLDRSPPDLKEVREALRCVVSDTERARDIIGRIRDHIKKAPPRKESFDLNEAIREVIALARSEVAKSGVLVEERLTEGLSPVRADRVQLQQVILNLILNAVEAMSSVCDDPRELLISTEQIQTDSVLVAVHDSGPGIDLEHLDRIFEAFYTTKSTGVGMGLSICRSIIDAHGGRLWAEANKPRGTEFRFTLPANKMDS